MIKATSLKLLEYFRLNIPFEMWLHARAKDGDGGRGCKQEV